MLKSAEGKLSVSMGVLGGPKWAQKGLKRAYFRLFGGILGPHGDPERGETRMVDPLRAAGSIAYPRVGA